MRLKPLALVVALLALAAGIVYWRGRAPVADPSADPRTGQPLVAAGTLAQLRGLRLVSAGQAVTLTADAHGQGWVVTEYHGLPADFGKLVTLVEALRSAKVTRFVTAQPERLERLGFTGDQIELQGGEGQPPLTLHLGKNADSGGRFVRFGDEAKAYLAALDAWLDSVPKNWAHSQLLDLKADAVSSLEFRFADGSTFTAKRDAEGRSWTAENVPEGKEPNRAAIDAVVAQLTTLRFSDTVEPAAPEAVAARDHAQTVVVTLQDGTSYTIALGRRPAPPVAGAEGEPQTADGAAETQTVGVPSAAAFPETPSPSSETAGVPPPQPGPAFVFIAANREADPINALMRKRAFQIGDWILTSLPANRAALLQDKPASPAPAAPPAAP